VVANVEENGLMASVYREEVVMLGTGRLCRNDERTGEWLAAKNRSANHILHGKIEKKQWS
jgi:hypothetical protein